MVIHFWVADQEEVENLKSIKEGSSPSHKSSNHLSHLDEFFPSVCGNESMCQNSS